ncbi:MAG: hypothetical protein QF445_01820 [Candidatus Poseidoniaceae archaeon]|nr:hypothetical protein [Candidatus Poseidoniaceae archaeon]
MWSVRLKVDSPNAKSLASSLVSEEELEITSGSFSFTLIESRAKDARAMWNTRLRSLVISSKLIKVMDS